MELNYDLFGNPLGTQKKEKTLKEAKAEMMAEINNGTHCPCCDRYIKRYKRKITSSMVIALIEFYKEQKAVGFGQWIDLKNLSIKSKMFLKVSGNAADFRKFTFWKIIERNLDNEKDQRGSGLYRITDDGISFVLGQSAIPERCYVFKNVAMLFSDNLVSITDCLKNKWSYKELMEPTT